MTDMGAADPDPAPPSGKACRQASLPAAIRALHRGVLRFFLDHGKPPAKEWLVSEATSLELAPVEAFGVLAESDLVYLEREVVTVAYPFSGTPTRHLVTPASGTPVYAMCAIDALGVLLMADCDGTVNSRDELTGEPVRVERANGRWRFEPPTTVVLAASSSEDGPSSCRSCPHINFHARPENAEAYLRARPDLDGSVLDQPSALDIAAGIFGSFLRSSDGT